MIAAKKICPTDLHAPVTDAGAPARGVQGTCTCIPPEALLGAGQRSQAQALYAEARAACDLHGGRLVPCLIVSCERGAGDGGMCALHDHYYRVVLADPRYRTETPPRLLPTGQMSLIPPTEVTT